MDLFTKSRRKSTSVTKSSVSKKQSALNARHSTSSLNSESKEADLSDALYEALMKDPQKRAVLLQLLSQEKETILKYKEIKEREKAKVNLKTKKNKFYFESPSSLMRRRALEKLQASESGSSSSVASDQLPLTPSPSVPFNKLLEGVIAYVEVNSKGEDRSSGAKNLMKCMGAVVKDTFSKDVTHVVFKDGLYSTYSKAKLLKVHLVSVLWLEAIRTTGVRVPEKKFPALGLTPKDQDATEVCLEFERDYEEVLKDEFQRSLAINASILSQDRDLDRFVTKRKPLTQECKSNLPNSSSSSTDDEGTHTPAFGKRSYRPSQTHSVKKELLQVFSSRSSCSISNSDNSDIDSDCGIIDGRSSKKNKNIQLDQSLIFENPENFPAEANKQEQHFFDKTDIINDSLEDLHSNQRKSSSTNESRSLLTGIKVRKTLHFSPEKSDNGKTSYELEDMEITDVANSCSDKLLNKVPEENNFHQLEDGNSGSSNSNRNKKSGKSRTKQKLSSSSKLNKAVTPTVSKISEHTCEELSNYINSNNKSETPIDTTHNSVQPDAVIPKNAMESNNSTSVNSITTRKSLRKSRRSSITEKLSSTKAPLVDQSNCSVKESCENHEEKEILPSSNQPNNYPNSSIITEDLSSLKISSSNCQSSNLKDDAQSKNTTKNMSSLKISTSNQGKPSSASNSMASLRISTSKSDSKNTEQNKDSASIVQEKSPLNNKCIKENADSILTEDTTNISESENEIRKIPTRKSTRFSRKNGRSNTTEDMSPPKISIDKKQENSTNSTASLRISTSTSDSRNAEQKTNPKSVVPENLSSIKGSPKKGNGKLNFDSFSSGNEENNEVGKSINVIKNHNEKHKIPTRRSMRNSHKNNELLDNNCQKTLDNKQKNYIPESGTESESGSSPDKSKKYKGKMRKLFNPKEIVMLPEQETEEDIIRRRQRVVEEMFKQPLPAVPLTPVLLTANAKKFVEQKKGESSTPSDTENLILTEVKIPKTKKKKNQKEVPNNRRSQDDEQKELFDYISNKEKNKKLSPEPLLEENGSSPKKKPKLADSGTEKEEDKEPPAKPVSRNRRRSVRLLSKKLTQKKKLKDVEAITPILNRRSSLDFVSKSKEEKLYTQKKTAKAKASSIVCTRLHKPDVQVFIRIVKKLGTFFVEEEVSNKTTHLVAGEAKRTINILRALARGCWILKIEWLYRSLEAGKWLNEEDYELTEFSPAVEQCRKQREAFGSSYSMDIFENIGYIYISRASTPRCSDLQELVTLCKGCITKTERLASIVVGEYSKREDVICVSEKWILDSITFNKRKPCKNYLIKSPPKVSDHF